MAFGVLALTVVALVAYSGWSARRTALTQAIQQADALANLAAEHGLGLFELTDGTLKRAADHFARRPDMRPDDAFRDWEFLHELERSTPSWGRSAPMHIMLADAQGDVVLHSRSYPAPAASLRGSGLRQVLADPLGPEPAVGLLPGDEVGNARRIALGRRIPGPDGSIVGYAVAALRPELSATLLAAMRPGPDSVLLLLHESGRLLDSQPAGTGRQPRTAPGPIVSAIAAGASGGTLTSECCGGGARLFAFRRMGDLPIYVAVGLAEKDVLAPWRVELQRQGLLASCVFGGFTVLTWLMLGQYRRQAAAHGLIEATQEASRTGLCILDETGRVASVNRAFADFAGRPPDTLTGLPISMVLPETGDLMARDGSPGGDAGQMLTLHRPGGETGTALVTVGRFVDGDGATRLVLAVNDISDLRRQERALAASEARLRAILDVAVSAVIVLDEQGRIDMANPAAERMFGSAAEDLRGRAVGTLVHEDTEGTVDLSRLTGRPQEVAARRADGTSIPAWIAVARFPVDGRAMYVAVLLDMTDRKRREEEVFQARREAEAARLQAETASRAKSEFLAHMSHELRTPLNAIIGFSEMMERRYYGPLGSPRYEEYSRSIHDSAQHLLSLINDILDLSKIEAGRYELREEAVDPTRLIASAVRLVRERAQRRDLDLRHLQGPDPLPAVRADERAIKQVLINLLSNAIKFTPSGGSIEVGAHPETDGDVTLWVRDTGIGIEEDQIPRVLEAFGQARSAYHAGEPGTGLGLPIVRSLVALHGGRLDIESRSGSGTTVRVRLPAWRVLERAASPETTLA